MNFETFRLVFIYLMFEFYNTQKAALPHTFIMIIRKLSRYFRCLIVSILFISCSIFHNTILLSANDDLNTSNEIGKSLPELVELRGYIAVNHYVTNKQGYILNLVEIRNPEINNGEKIGPKDPILFVHGTLTNGKFFVVNSVGAKPKNYANIDAGSLSIEELTDLLGDDPTTNTLAFTASNFGHSVWILNRRGTAASQGHIRKDTQPYKNPISNVAGTFAGGLLPPTAALGRKKRQVNLEEEQPLQVLYNILMQNNFDFSHLELLANPRYWNFSMDEQASDDFPGAMDYVLERTGREKLSVVTHSAGGAIFLMALTDNPDLANKISKSINYAPALYPVGLRSTVFGGIFGPFLMTYNGPVPPSVILPLIHHVISAVCSFGPIMDTLCQVVDGFAFGTAGNQQLIFPGIGEQFIDTFSSHSIAQLIQAAYKGKMYKYDFINPLYNLAVYNQTKPPLYDVSRITSKTITIWVGNKDGLVTLKDAKRVINDMSVSPKLYYIDGPGLSFNHDSFALHFNVSRLCVIPTIKELETKE